MVRESRVFGNNMAYLIKKMGWSVAQFAKRLDYTEYEVYRMIDGRILLDSEEKSQIASCLRTTVDKMFVPLDDSQYAFAGCMECRGKFSNDENKEKVLDIFDMYCDIQEILQEV